MKNKILDAVKKSILPTLVDTALFFLNYFLFGAENAMIAPFATLVFIRFLGISNHYECMLKSWLFFMAMTVLAHLAVLNLPLCIIINALALFWLAYGLIDEYNPSNYFPYGMALIFFQIAPAASLKNLGMRLCAVCTSFAVIFVFIFIVSLIKKDKSPICSYIRQGLGICEELLENYKNGAGDASAPLHHEICALNKKISDEIYTYNRSSVRLAGKVNWYCRYVILFQIINYFTGEPYEAESFESVSAVFDDFSQQFENRNPSKDYKRLHFRNSAWNIHTFRFRFALRLSLVVTPCMVFAYLSPWENSYWLVISVFFMMIPVYENTKKRILERVFGTIAGIFLCFILFSVFDAFAGRVIVRTIAGFFIYAVNSYSIKVAFITCSALSISTINASIGTVLLQRVIYTLAGAAIAALANRFIFPIRTRVEMGHLKERLDKIRLELMETEENAAAFENDEERFHKTDELVIKSYILMKRLEAYYESLPEAERTGEFERYRKEYMAFMGSFMTKYFTRGNSQ